VWNNEHKGRNKEAMKYTNINKKYNFHLVIETPDHVYVLG